jgi:hypothetical protein
MAKDKKSFILYADLIGLFNKLTDEQAGKLIKIIFEYVNDNDPKIEDDQLLEIAFEPIKMHLKRDLKKYELFREKQSENGKQGGRPKKPKPLKENPKNPSLNSETQKSLSVSDSVIVSAIDIETKKEREEAKSQHPLQVLISQDYPNVSKMKSQLTQSQAETIQAKYKPEEIKSVLDGMENHATLTKKYTSVSLTIQGWLKRRQETGGNKQPIGAYIMPKDHF